MTPRLADMAAPGRQATLYDFGLTPPPDLQTEPPTYLNHNDSLETEQLTLDGQPWPPCPFCDAHPENREKHLLLEHPQQVSDHIAERAAESNGTPEPADEPRSAPIGASGPVMFGEVDTDSPGQRVDGYEDPRVCNGCETRMSKRYAHVFANEAGELHCPDCKPRSERYSNNPTYGPDHESDPSTVTGSSNARSHAHSTPSWREAEPS